MGCRNADGNNVSPNGGVPANNTTALAYGAIPPQTALAPQAVSPVGGSQPHTNFQPYLCVHFIISLFGLFPNPSGGNGGAEPFLSELRMFSFGYAPGGWAQCNGQFLPINQNQALFALLGTTYGGNGQTTFALPNLQGSAPMHSGQGPGLSFHDLGETGGSETVTLLQSEMPAHNHNYQVRPTAAVPPQSSPVGLTGARSNSRPLSPAASGTNVQMNQTAASPTGGSLPHNNLMPYLTLNFYIALQGVFPPQS